MKVNVIQVSPEVRYKPIVDTFIKTIEATLPDSIDELKIRSCIDWTEYKDNYGGQLEVTIHVKVDGVIRDPNGTPRQIATRKFSVASHIQAEYTERSSYEEHLNRCLYADLTNIILHIIHFSKTGEVERNDDFGRLKQLNPLES